MISEIKKMPTVINNTHESVYKSFNILNLVIDMLERGDSPETILIIIKHLREAAHE